MKKIITMLQFLNKTTVSIIITAEKKGNSLDSSSCKLVILFIIIAPAVIVLGLQGIVSVVRSSGPYLKLTSHVHV